jgi:solute carrier family 50 (sugar transporter)
LVSESSSFATSSRDSSEEGKALTTEGDEEPVLQKAIDFGKLVWDISSQKIQAPAPHETTTMCMVCIWLGAISFISLVSLSQETRELFIGVLVNLNLVFFYGAPLSTILEVLKTKSSASIHTRTMFTNSCNSAFWTAYGLAIQDWFVYVPNGIGACLGAIQICLCLIFPRQQIKSKEGTTDIVGSPL